MTREGVRVLHVPTEVGRLYVEEAGAGPALLLWPDLFCDARSLASQVEEFRRDHRVLAVDPPGHGLSGPPVARLTLAACAHAVAEVLDAAGILDTVIVGSGWGGMVGVAFATAYPARARALALLNTPLHRQPLPRRVELGALILLYRLLGPHPLLTRPILDAFMSPATRASRPERARLVEESFRIADRGGLAAAMGAVLVDRPSLLKTAARLRLPVLSLTGSEDDLFTPRQAEAQALRIPRARFEVVEGSARLSALEAPRRVNALLREFLGSLTLSRQHQVTQAPERG